MYRYLMNSLEERSLLNSLILRYVLRSLSESLVLLGKDSTLTLDSHSSRLIEGHAENVVGLNTATDAAVARNGIAQSLCAVGILIHDTGGLANDLSGNLAILALLGGRSGETLGLINLKSKL